MESLTYGGHNRELDFGGPLAPSCDKFGNTIVYYTTHCPLGAIAPWPPGSASCDMVIVNSFICR